MRYTCSYLVILTPMWIPLWPKDFFKKYSNPKSDFSCFSLMSTFKKNLLFFFFFLNIHHPPSRPRYCMSVFLYCFFWLLHWLLVARIQLSAKHKPLEVPASKVFEDSRDSGSLETCWDLFMKIAIWIWQKKLYKVHKVLCDEVLLSSRLKFNFFLQVLILKGFNLISKGFIL